MKYAEDAADKEIAEKIRYTTIIAIGTFEFDRVEAYNILDNIMIAIEDYGTSVFDRGKAYKILAQINRSNK